jgi:hypothetical protein
MNYIQVLSDTEIKTEYRDYYVYKWDAATNSYTKIDDVPPLAMYTVFTGLGELHILNVG